MLNKEELGGRYKGQESWERKETMGITVLLAMDWVHSPTKAGYHPLEVGLIISILQLEQSKREVHLPMPHR